MVSFDFWIARTTMARYYRPSPGITVLSKVLVLMKDELVEPHYKPLKLLRVPGCQQKKLKPGELIVPLGLDQHKGLFPGPLRPKHF